MRADHSVDLAGFHVDQVLFLLLRGHKPAQHGDRHRKRGESLLKRLVVLIAKDGCRRQHRDLFSIRNRFESGAHGHFGLAVSHVSADEAVHRHRRFHISLDVGDGGYLIRGLFVLKGLFKFLLPLGIG